MLNFCDEIINQKWLSIWDPIQSIYPIPLTADEIKEIGENFAKTVDGNTWNETLIESKQRLELRRTQIRVDPLEIPGSRNELKIQESPKTKWFDQFIENLIFDNETANFSNEYNKKLYEDDFDWDEIDYGSQLILL